MAETRTMSTNNPMIWDRNFTIEMYQHNPFAAYAGTGSNKPIVMKEEFTSQKGNGISFEFITKLSKETRFDYDTLRGNEEQLGEYGDRVYWRQRMKGITMHEIDCKLSAIDLRKAAKDVLKQWAEEDLIRETIQQLGAVGESCDVLFHGATTDEKNAWLSKNTDRVSFGGSVQNLQSDFETSMASIDSETGLFSCRAVTTLKTLALLASPRITPVTSSIRGRRYFIAFVPTLLFNDFVQDCNYFNSCVSIISKNEEIFRGGDREFDGVILHQVDDMPVYPKAGRDKTDVYPVYLLGQEALGWAIKSRYKTREEYSDYGRVHGIAMIGDWGIKKLCYSPTFSTSLSVQDATILGKQRGVVTGFFATKGLQ